MKALGVALLFALGCTSSGTEKREYKLTGDTCQVHADPESCAMEAGCQWFDLGIPCQEGQPCTSGVCSSTSGSGSGSSGGGTGSGSAGCACFDGGVCFEQLGGPAMSGTGPDIQCYPPAACPGGCASVCDSIQGQGTCTPDPNVTNLCLCDNGIR